MFKFLLFTALAFLVCTISANQKCPPHQVFTIGTACPPVCPFLDPKTGKINDGKPTFCTKIAVPGCFCVKGYIFASKTNHTCIKPSQCPPVFPVVTSRPLITCGPNQTLAGCANCPEHCPVFNPKTGQVIPQYRICYRNCAHGCHCMIGYVIDPKKGNACVKKEDCTSVVNRYPPKGVKRPIHIVG